MSARNARPHREREIRRRRVQPLDGYLRVGGAGCRIDTIQRTDVATDMNGAPAGQVRA